MPTTLLHDNTSSFQDHYELSVKISSPINAQNTRGLHSSLNSTLGNHSSVSSSSVLTQAINDAQSTLKNFAADSAFVSKMTTAFGPSWDLGVATQLSQGWAAYDFQNLPKLEIRLGSEINGANGAFVSNTNKIYISREFLSQNADNPYSVTSVLLEEIGHAIDFRINRVDAAGDEGDIFSRLVRGETISAHELLQLKTEDDHAFVTIDGKLTEIEMSQVGMSSFSNKLFQTVRGMDNKIYTRSTTDSVAWSGWSESGGGYTSSAIATSTFGNKLFQALRGEDNSIYTRSTADGKTWTNWTKTDDLGKTSSAVSMSIFGNKLFQTVRGMDNSIYTRSTADGTKWTTWTKTDDFGKTPSAVSMSIFGNKLFQAHRGTDNSIYTRSTADGTTWTNWAKTDDLGKTPSAVSMSIFGNKLFQAVRGVDNSIYTRSTADGTTWTNWAKTDDLGKTPSAVSMSTFGNKLFQTVQGMDNSIHTRSTADGKTWTTWKKTDDLGKTLTEAEDITDNLPLEQYRWQAVYYNNNSLTGAPVFGRVEGNATGFSNSWGSGGPGIGVGNDNFSARYTGAFKFEAAQYTFKPNADDGFRIWIDGKLYHDAWNTPSQKTFQLGLSAGVHNIKVEYRELTGNAQAQFSWEKVDRLTLLTQKSSLLTIDEINEYRKLVSQKPESDRAQWYKKLQDKTPYFNQRNNQTPGVSGDIMCNVTALANCLTYVGIKNPIPTMQFEDYLEKYRKDKGYGSRESWKTLSDIARDLGALPDDKSGFGTTNGSFDANQIKRALDRGSAVMVSVVANGIGHIVRFQGYDDNGFIVDDPFGRATDGQGSYQSANGPAPTYKTLNSKTGDGEEQVGSNNKWSWDYAKKNSSFFLVINQAVTF